MISIRARPLPVIPETFDKILLQHLIPDPSEAGWFVRTTIASFYLQAEITSWVALDVRTYTFEPNLGDLQYALAEEMAQIL